MVEQMSATDPNVPPDGQSRCPTPAKREAFNHTDLFTTKSKNSFVCRDATKNENRFHIPEVKGCEGCSNNESAYISEADKVGHPTDFSYDTVSSSSFPGAITEDTSVSETSTSTGAAFLRDMGPDTVSPTSFMDFSSSISVPPGKCTSSQLFASDLPMTNLSTSGRQLSDPSPAPAVLARNSMSAYCTLPMQAQRSKRRRRRAARNRGASHTSIPNVKRPPTLPVQSPSQLNTSQLPRKTPAGFTHYLADQHPWARLVNPRPICVLEVQLPSQVITSLDTNIYRHLPDSGYMSAEFNKSLFPHVTLQEGGPPIEIPFIELQHLEDTIAFRWRSQQVINSLIAGTYFEFDLVDVEETSSLNHPYTTVPPVWNGYRPVLYQVVSKGWGGGVVLEAKDFFTVGPDRRDLHCVIVDKFAIEILAGGRGFNKSLISVKDFVWVYDVKPTLQAFQSPQTTLERSRIPRTTALENRKSEFFFRVSHFAFVTPTNCDAPIYGMILSVSTHHNRITHARAAFEGCPEAVTLTPHICSFPLHSLVQYEIVTALSRFNVSSAMRFSEPPVSLEARSKLCEYARRFLPMHPEEGIVPLSVFKTSAFDLMWFADRLRDFNNFHLDTDASKLKLAKICNAACSTLAAVDAAHDDRQSHRCIATVTTPSCFPLRLQFTLCEMISEAGWAPGRNAALSISGADSLIRVEVVDVVSVAPQKELNVVVRAFLWSHHSLKVAVDTYGRNVGSDRVVEICIRLGKSTAAADPVYELISHSKMFDGLLPGSTGSRIIDVIFAKKTLGTSDEPYLRDLPAFYDAQRTFYVGGRLLTLTPNQSNAIRIGTGQLPIVAFQAAFGTGKTLIGALIAAISSAEPDTTVIVTTSSNSAVAQFTETLLSLDDFPDLKVVRHISDTAEFANLSPTAVDLNKILKTLGDDFGDQLERADLELCANFKRYRQLLEEYVEYPERALEMSEDNKKEYEIAERYVSQTLKHMVRIMFQVRRPSVICMTTTSLLNSTAASGIFESYIPSFKIVIGDEMSQIPEAALFTIVCRLQMARHVYIGDEHQLAPHARCPRDSNPVLHGARSVMCALLHAPAVPVITLMTTFRAHPALIELPNVIAYDGALVSGTPPNSRQMLLSVMNFPAGNVPFMFIDTDGESVCSDNKSHYNETEARVCIHLIRQLIRKGISPGCICVIIYYREQYRRMKSSLDAINVEVATVDSVQGREREVVIILTTRTDFTPDCAEFLDDYRRLNVAITRCRQGQFILGHAASLQRIPNWNRVLQWSNSLHAIIRPEQINRYLRLPE